MVSTNDGVGWTQIYDQYTNCLTINGNSLYAGTYVKGVQIYNGSSWIPGNNGLSSNPIIKSIHIHNNNIFFGQVGNKIWKAGMNTIGITNTGSAIPDEYNLSQNFPNPFNPSTKIRFDIKNSGLVNLKVFDLLGKEVAILVNEKLSAGSYETDFDGSKFSSGVYFYKLETRYYTEIKKMTLVK